MHKYGESKTTRIMMATVCHVTSSSGLRKFQANGFLFDRVYVIYTCVNGLHNTTWQAKGWSPILYWKRSLSCCSVMVEQIVE